MKQIAIGLILPVNNDFVQSPEVCYVNNSTEICFKTDDKQFGRISFHNLDSIKVSRGEQLPFKDDWTEDKEVPWVYVVENSQWLINRHSYEKDVYGGSYEFGGNVDEMLTDFRHFIFQFHDEFIEVIARGFWLEKDSEKLNGKPLKEQHPLLPLNTNNIELLELNTIKCRLLYSEYDLNTLIANSEFCEQKRIEFQTEYNGRYSQSYTLVIFRRNGKIFSGLRGFFGNFEFEKEGIATLEEVYPIFEKHTLEISERQKNNLNKLI